MGVPGFVTWLRGYCKDAMILTSLPKGARVLYIDGNCLIHPKCFEVLEFCKDIVDIGTLETIMFKRICKFIDFLIDYVSPEECYFAVDGVAPVAKINQQRKRRFRAIDDAIMRDDLKIKHKLNASTKWSNTVITPGTDFMERLHQHFMKYFDSKIKNNRRGTKYVYSSYHTSGEGEHKIFNNIRERMCAGKQAVDNDLYVIYGLDADLFFLSMASQKRNLYLLREELCFVHGKPAKHEIVDIIDDIAEEMRFVSIDITKRSYDDRVKHIISQKLAIFPPHKMLGANDDDYWNDFVFICYLLGNDFLPHLPSIDVHKSGLDIIIDCYTDIVIDTNSKLISVKRDRSLQCKQVTINNVFLAEFLRDLGDKEEEYFIEILPEQRFHKQKRRCFASDEYSRELWKIENMKFEVHDPVMLGTGSKGDWKFRYYEYYFGVSEYYQEHVDLMAKSYLEGLLWVTKYYYSDCPSWSWQYPFTHAPFISDIYRYLSKGNVDVNGFKFVQSKPLEPYIQLLSVLPPSCTSIIPKKYAHLAIDAESPIIDMFPKKVELDMVGKDMHWMCIPMLPYLDIGRILNAVGAIKLSAEDNARNRECSDFLF
jgi:5'-3' exonuclease